MGMYRSQFFFVKYTVATFNRKCEFEGEHQQLLRSKEAQKKLPSYKILDRQLG